jgi:hypothetical protein
MGAISTARLVCGAGENHEVRDRTAGRARSRASQGSAVWYGGLGGPDAINESTEVFVTKRASKSTRVTAAKRGGRTIGSTAKRSSRLKVTPKKAARRKATLQKATPTKPTRPSRASERTIPDTAVRDRATPATELDQDPVAEATQTTLRKTWRGQQQDAEAFAKIQHGAIVDQRAHVRATTGHRWTARKTQ